jgi:hypothetical protein
MTIRGLSIAQFDIRSYLYEKFLNPFVYSISKLDRLLLQNDVAGLFFCPKTKSEIPMIPNIFPQGDYLCAAFSGATKVALYLADHPASFQHQKQICNEF